MLFWDNILLAQNDNNIYAECRDEMNLGGGRAEPGAVYPRVKRFRWSETETEQGDEVPVEYLNCRKIPLVV